MSLLPIPRFQFPDSNGDPLPGAKLYFYEAGTSTELDTYSDSALSVPNANPVVADSGGLFGAIYLSATSYKVVFKDASEVEQWTQDNVDNDTVYNQGGTGAVDRTKDSRLRDRISVADFLAVGDGVADDTEALQAAFAALTSGGALDFGFGKTYRIYPTGALLGGALTFASFEDIDGVQINGNGSTLAVEDTLTTGESIKLFSFDNCKNCVVENFKVTSDQTVAGGSSGFGTNIVDATNSTINLVVRNMYVVGGYTGVRCLRTVASEAESTKVSDVLVENCYFENVGYPLSFQNSGDNVTVRNVKMDYCYRAYFPYGVRNHDIDIEVKNPSQQYVNISAYSTDTTTNYCENIRVNLTVPDFDLTSSIGACTVVALHDTAANGCTLRDIHLNVNIKFNDTSSDNQKILDISKYLNGAGVDSTTGRGHIFENISLSGSMNGVDIADHVTTELFSLGDFTGETCRNIALRDLSVTGSTNQVISLGNLSAMTGEFLIENCYFSGGSTALSVSNWGTYGVRLRNTFLGQFYFDSSAPRTYTTTGSMGAYHGLAYLDSASGALTMTMPNGITVGQFCTIVMTNATASSTVSVTNHETSDPEVFTFAQVGDTLTLMWQGDQWITVANSGVTV